MVWNVLFDDLNGKRGVSKESGVCRLLEHTKRRTGMGYQFKQLARHRLNRSLLSFLFSLSSSINLNSVSLQ